MAAIVLIAPQFCLFRAVRAFAAMAASHRNSLAFAARCKNPKLSGTSDISRHARPRRDGFSLHLRPRHQGLPILWKWIILEFFEASQISKLVERCCSHSIISPANAAPRFTQFSKPTLRQRCPRRRAASYLGKNP